MTTTFLELGAADEETKLEEVVTVFAEVTHMRHFCVFRTCPECSGQVPIFQPSSAHSCECSITPGMPESPGVLLPGDSAHTCIIRSLRSVDISRCVSVNLRQKQPTTNNQQPRIHNPQPTTNPQPTHNQPTTNQQPTNNQPTPSLPPSLPPATVDPLGVKVGTPFGVGVIPL